MASPEFVYADLLPTGADPTPYRLVTTDGVRSVAGPGGHLLLEVAPEALRLLTAIQARALDALPQ